MNRGRPKKRGDSVVWQRSPMKANDNGQLIPKNQTCRISLSELHTLRNYAEDRVSNHDILTQMQVTELNQVRRLSGSLFLPFLTSFINHIANMYTQELKALDESYISIQRTISELKESRKAAYLSMKSYLESSSSSSPSGNTTSIRDHFMKQTKALYELDTQLDALQSKLDSAAERRLTIQSKVWEHLTAILTATTLVGGVGRSEEYTPPRSPERFTGRRLSDAAIQEEEDAIYNSSPRNDIESITIFADSGVANLLRSIEEELDVIDQFRYQDDEEINAFEKDAQFCMI